MNIIAKLIKVFATLLIIIFGIFIFWAASNSQGKFIQPIAYNHKLHIEEVDFTCLDCHLNAETHTRASIPNIEFCRDCHDDIEVENPEESKVAEYVNSDIKIKWVQVHTVPDYAYFSHRRHVKLAQIDCTICHGEVSQMETPFVKSYLIMDMSWCMDCHAQHGVTNDCYACHR
jgi:hypothetical protein